LVEAGYVVDPADLYTLDPAEISVLEMAGRRVGASADKAVNNLNAKKTLPLHVIVGSLGISMIGRTMAKTIVDAGYNTLSLMYRARINHPLVLSSGHTLPALSSVVGDKKASSFVEGFQEKVGLIAKLLCNGIQVASITGSLVGKSFCLTGFRDAALSDAIEKAGGSVKSSVSKDLSYLIALDSSSNSGKAAKARAYGVPVISPEEALQMVTA
jgi:DNA ligase (NAD+)